MKFSRSLLQDRHYKMFIASCSVLILSLLTGAVIFVLIGKNPITAYTNFLQGVGLLPKLKYPGRQSQLTDFMSFLDAMTPMIFASLSVSIALKGGFFNIGVPGQMLTAGIFAHIFSNVVGSFMPSFAAKIFVLIVGIIIGASLGAFMGWLKYRFNVNEVVTSIMLNSISMYLIAFYINTFYINPVSRQSRVISDAARLTLKGIRWDNLKIDIAIAFPLAILAAFLLRGFLNKTTWGFEIKALGLSKSAVRYAGIDPGHTTLLTMTISGAFGGLAGVSYFCGYFASIQPGVLPNTGFDCIAVALLGGCEPLGCILSSFLVTIISKGSSYMNSRLGVEVEIASLITSIILIFAACSEHFIGKKARS